MTIKTLSLYILLLFLVCACGSEPTKSMQTLADIDIETKENKERKKTSLVNNVYTPKNTHDIEQIKQAYYQYIRNAKNTDNSRQSALNRLAQLELDFTEKLAQEAPENDVDLSPQYKLALENTAQLLNTALEEFPNAKNTDSNLYQLARTYNQLGEHEKSDEKLFIIATKHPRSEHYAEAQFRLAERAFARGDYITAEDAYTQVIFTPLGDRFYEKSVFKRGWTRYKQQLYEEALDDYIDVIKKFNDITFDKDNSSEKNIFDEYLRAIALASAQLEAPSGMHNYFSNKQEYPFVFETYREVAKLYVKQERFSDSSNTLKQFIRYNPNSEHLPFAYIQVLDGWEKGEFKANLFRDINTFYNDFNPSAPYWKNINATIPDPVAKSMRNKIVLVAKNYHQEYENTQSNTSFENSQKWYQRYLQHFKPYANKNKIYSAYAELLMSAKLTDQALEYFELAAFDGDLILDKKSAYSALSIASNIYDQKVSQKEKKKALDKYLRYSMAFVSLYPNDSRSTNIALRSAQLSFNENRYAQALTYTNILPGLTPQQSLAMKNIQARSFFELKQYTDAETLFSELLTIKTLTKKQQHNYLDSMAISIYKQGDVIKEKNKQDAYVHFSRISDLAPNSDIAATGLYDAISLSINEKNWSQSIAAITKFKALYPKHKHIKSVNKSLTVAYLQSDQQGKAAQAFEQLAKSDDDQKVRRAAQWKAAELYEKKNQNQAAIRAYREFAHNFPEPYEQNVEAMFKLVGLYTKTKDNQKKYFWQNQIQKKDAKASQKNQTERTQYIASHTILDLALQKKIEFNTTRLIEPLAKNLKKKKAAMQDSIRLYGRASSYGIAQITTESTYSIGRIYRDFSLSLLNSQRPKHLKGDELEQYDILLEDQAFPFEEKAIEFYETNVARVQDIPFDSWMSKSFNELKELFPVRYARSPKIGLYDE